MTDFLGDIPEYKPVNQVLKPTELKADGLDTGIPVLNEHLQNTRDYRDLLGDEEVEVGDHTFEGREVLRSAGIFYDSLVEEGDKDEALSYIGALGMQTGAEMGNVPEMDEVYWQNTLKHFLAGLSQFRQNNISAFFYSLNPLQGGFGESYIAKDDLKAGEIEQVFREGIEEGSNQL